MLDVHAPEHEIDSARSFFLHLFTITCGLLIALALENAAEALHHRSERREAQESIRRELEENRTGARAGAPRVVKSRQAVGELLEFAETRSQGKEATLPSGAGFAFSEDEIPDAAWRTASSTGVLSYMEYSQVQTFAAAYREQELLQRQEQQALNDLLQLGSFFRKGKPPTVTAEQAKDALPYLRRCLADLDGILAIGAGTLSAYDDALK